MLGQLIRCRSGAAAAEMALVAPLLLAVMFGAMELGYYFYSEHVVVKAVRDGARFASRAGFSDYDCPTKTVDPSVVTDTQRVTRTNQVASGGPARLPGWTSDASVSVDMSDSKPIGTYGSIYAGMTCVPVVKVTATVTYTSLFSLLGFNTTSLQLQAESEATVMGI
jgi:Flp pilus assembly protein TadG